MGPVRSPTRRSWCRRRSATTCWDWKSSDRSCAASAHACTTRPRNERCCRRWPAATMCRGWSWAWGRSCRPGPARSGSASAPASTTVQAIYIGRIDENKGCAELFDFWTRYSEITPGGLTLALVGTPVLPVPVHPRIRHLGFVTDQEKFDALDAADPDHAVVLREPVDGGTRGLGHGQAGARQRPVRCAARTGDAQQRRALLRELRRVRRSRAGARRLGRRGRGARPQRPPFL